MQLIWMIFESNGNHHIAIHSMFLNKTFIVNVWFERHNPKKGKIIMSLKTHFTFFIMKLSFVAWRKIA